MPELVPEEIARKSHYKFDQAAPIAKVGDLAAYDAIVVGAGARFGRLPFPEGWGWCYIDETLLDLSD